MEGEGGISVFRHLNWETPMAPLDNTSGVWKSGRGKGRKTPKIVGGISSHHLTALFSAQMFSLEQIKEKKFNGTNGVGGKNYIDITVTKFTA